MAPGTRCGSLAGALVAAVAAAGPPLLAAQCPEEGVVALDPAQDDQLGGAVALDGTLGLVGAARKDDEALGDQAGAVYFFEFDAAAGAWVERQKVTAATSGDADDNFGQSVDLRGDVAVVGAWGNSLLAQTAGAAYVLRRDVVSGRWFEEQRLHAPDAEPFDRFGWSVAVEGDLVAVGAAGEDQAGDFAGAVYLFRRQVAGGAWVFAQKLIPPTPAGGDQFGRTLSLSDGRLLVGAHKDDDLGNDAGAAYLFADPGTGVFALRRKLVASDGSPGAAFGEAVSLSGEVAVVGAHWEPSLGLNAGAAYVFRRDPASGQWLEEAKLLAGDGAALDQFGTAVAVASERVAVGATGAGALYVFERAGPAGWLEIERHVPAGTQFADRVGEAVALGPALALVGAPSDDTLFFRGGLAVFHAIAVDCNENGTPDFCDIASGAAPDLDGNQVPDECEVLIGTSFCSPSVPNSTGTGARAEAVGSPLAGGNFLRLRAFRLPPQQFGYFVASRTPGLIPNPGGSQGLLCLGGEIARFNDVIAFSGASGEFTRTVDTQAIPTSPPAPILPGEVWRFQAWYRDLNPQQTSNFTSGIAITFQ